MSRPGTRSSKEVLSRVGMLWVICGGALAIPASADPCDDVAASAAHHGPVLLVYDEFASSRGAAREPNPGVLVTDNLHVFGQWVRQFAGRPGFAGTLGIIDCRHPTASAGTVPIAEAPGCGGGGGGSGGGSAPPAPSVTVLVYDQATLDMWNETGFVPAFMDGVEVEEIPLEDAVFDLDLEAADQNWSIRHTKLRVRKSDGAIAIVSSEIVAEGSSPDDSSVQPTDATTCDAGWAWPGCCGVQRVICRAVQNILWFLPCNCSECSKKCSYCCVNNPCHSCGFCGLSWLLCRLPGGHC